jgi:hypothetical protein
VTFDITFGGKATISIDIPTAPDLDPEVNALEVARIDVLITVDVGVGCPSGE